MTGSIRLASLSCIDPQGGEGLPNHDRLQEGSKCPLPGLLRTLILEADIERQ